MIVSYVAYLIIALLAALFLSAAIRILREYERGVVFTLGRFTGVKGPGLIILVPFVQQMVRVDLRVVVQDVPPQDVISRDNVSVKVNAVLYFRIVDAERAIIQVEDFMTATNQLAQTTLRSVLGKHELITYAVGLDTQGRVRGVEILDYRESHGGEIRDPQWRLQFAGKTAREPLQLDRDIRNISGATLSCRHVTDGVKRILALYESELRNR